MRTLRQLKVSGQYHREAVPFIRLSGKCLARAGFMIGGTIIVRVEERALTIIQIRGVK